MSENILNPVAVARDILINLVVVAFSAAGGWWINGTIYAVAGFAVGILIINLAYKRGFERIRRFIKLKYGGVTGYYFTFDLAKNKHVFDEIKKSFYYMGVSGFTVAEYFKERAARAPALEECRFLLMDPAEKETLFRQIAFKRGVSLGKPLEELDEGLCKEIEDEVQIEVDRIKATIGALKGTDLYRKNGGLKIRLYKGFAPWWMYIIDGKKAYVGVLPQGENGLNAPVVVLSKVEGFASQYAAFKNMWDKLWADATPA